MRVYGVDAQIISLKIITHQRVMFNTFAVNNHLLTYILRIYEMRAIAYTVLLGLVILPNSVFAENAVQNNNDNQQTTTDSTIVTTQPIVIEGQQQVPASSTSLNVEEAKEQIQKIPGGVAIKDAEDYKNSRATTLKDILDYTPGVLIQSRINEEASLSIRGSGLSRTFHLRGVNLYQDHVPINLADGFADFQDIDPLAYEYTEVYKGANALKFGSSTLGGAVNFVTPTGYNSDMITVRLEGGSFGTVREQITSGGVYGNADYYVSLSNIMSNGYRDFSDQNNTRFSSNFGYKFNPKLETRFYINLADINQELPGNLTKTQLEDDPKQANANNKNNNYQRDFQTMRLSNKTTWHGEGYDISGGIYTVQKELFHPIFQVIDQESSNYGIFADSTIT
jgi:iron complex outermembrane receptor protein